VWILAKLVLRGGVRGAPSWGGVVAVCVGVVGCLTWVGAAVGGAGVRGLSGAFGDDRGGFMLCWLLWCWVWGFVWRVGGGGVFWCWGRLFLCSVVVGHWLA